MRGQTGLNQTTYASVFSRTYNSQSIHQLLYSSGSSGPILVEVLNGLRYSGTSLSLPYELAMAISRDRCSFSSSCSVLYVSRPSSDGGGFSNSSCSCSGVGTIRVPAAMCFRVAMYVEYHATNNATMIAERHAMVTRDVVSEMIMLKG